MRQANKTLGLGEAGPAKRKRSVKVINRPARFQIHFELYILAGLAFLSILVETL